MLLVWEFPLTVWPWDEHRMDFRDDDDDDVRGVRDSGPSVCCWALDDDPERSECRVSSTVNIGIFEYRNIQTPRDRIHRNENLKLTMKNRPTIVKTCELQRFWRRRCRVERGTYFETILTLQFERNNLRPNISDTYRGTGDQLMIPPGILTHFY